MVLAPAAAWPCIFFLLAETDEFVSNNNFQIILYVILLVRSMILSRCCFTLGLHGKHAVVWLTFRAGVPHTKILV